MSGASSSDRPITRKRMLFASSVPSSERRYRFSSIISMLTSARRTLPVLDGEGVQRQHVDAEPRRRLDDVADGIDAGAMAFDTRQMPLCGPAAVAVHDDGDMRGQMVEVHLPCQRLVRGSWRNPGQELLKRHQWIPEPTAARMPPKS